MTTRVAIISGATSGIGEATATRLVECGFRVVANGRRKDRLDAFVSAVNARGGDAVAVAGHAGDAEVIDRMLNASHDTWQQAPDVFVLCAGVGLPGTILTSDPGRWRALFEVNYLAVLNQLRACGKRFVSDAQSSQTSTVRDIVVIGSTVGRALSAANPVYGSTKFAIHSLVESLRQEVCPFMIRVTLIEPGFVKSGFQETAGYDMAWFASVEQDAGPLLSPHDIARTIEFVIQQPPHVHLDDIRIRPTRQKA